MQESDKIICSNNQNIIMNHFQEPGNRTFLVVKYNTRRPVKRNPLALESPEENTNRKANPYKDTRGLFQNTRHEQMGGEKDFLTIQDSWWRKESGEDSSS